MRAPKVRSGAKTALGASLPFLLSGKTRSECAPSSADGVLCCLLSFFECWRRLRCLTLGRGAQQEEEKAVQLDVQNWRKVHVRDEVAKPGVGRRETPHGFGADSASAALGGCCFLIPLPSSSASSIIFVLSLFSSSRFL